MALLAHVLQLVGGWIAPLIIFCVRRQSRFVSFHALQVLLLQAAYLVLTLFVVFVVIVAIALGIFASATLPQHGPDTSPMFFLFLPFFWLAWLAAWVSALVGSIVIGVKASRGEWAEYPVVGRWARQILKIGPGGVAVQAAVVQAGVVQA